MLNEFMATHLKNLSNTALKPNPAFHEMYIGIVVSEWNPQITHALCDGAIAFLRQMGVSEKHIITYEVPGTFELPLGAQWLAQNAQIDAVIALGCVIQGETRHFDFICDAAANGIMQVGLSSKKPVVFGVLTTQNMQQAIDRAGGKHGNKGIEAAESALKMHLVSKTLPQ
jgi:6,7-dimethyl-8-ribityllumazine synthase